MRVLLVVAVNHQATPGIVHCEEPVVGPRDGVESHLHPGLFALSCPDIVE